MHVDLPQDLYVAGGVYEINPHNLDNDFVIGHFKGATGALSPVESGWTRGGDDGHVGSNKVGGWIGTADGDDVHRNVATGTGLAPLQHASRYGAYFTMQQLTGTSKVGKALTGLSMFVNVTQADRNTSVTDNQVSLGLFYKGLVPAVPGDVLDLAVARTDVNGRAAQADRAVPDTPVRHAEYAAELYYAIHPADWLELRPNVQHIHNPGGIRQANDVGVLGLKAVVTL